MSITLDGIRVSDLGFRILEGSSDPILPDTRDRLLTLSGRHGIYDFGADLGAKFFAFKCAFVADGTNYTKPSAVELQKRVRQLAAYLTDANGRPKSLRLVFDREPDKYYTVRYAGSLGIDRMIYSSVGTFTLPLMAVDPFAYGSSDAYDKEYLYDTGLEYDSELLYPNPTGFRWLNPEQRSSLNNYSANTTDIVITISGQASSPSVEHEQSGKRLHLPSIGAGETLIIDTKKMSVRKNGMNGMPQSSGDFFQLSPGANGLIFRCASANTTVSYDWQHKFL